MFRQAEHSAVRMLGPPTARALRPGEMEPAGQQKRRDSEKGLEPTKKITCWQPQEASHKTHRSRQPSSKFGAGRELRHSSKFCCNTIVLPTFL